MDKIIVKNIFSKLILNFFRLVFPVMILPLIYRRLGSRGIGELSFYESIYSYFEVIAVFGIYNYGIKEIAKNRNNLRKSNKLFNELFVINALLNFLATFLYAIVIVFYLLTSNNRYVLLVLLIKLGIIFFNLDWINEGKENYFFISVKTIILRSISLILMLILVRKEENLVIYCVINLFYDIGMNITTICYLIKKKYIKFKCIKFKYIKFIFLKYIKKIFMITLMTQYTILYFQFDKIILGIKGNDIDVAYYTISERIVFILISLLVSFSQTLFPRLSYYIENDIEQYNKYLEISIEYIMLLVVPLIFMINIFSKGIILNFAGIDFIGAYKTLNIFAIYIILFIYNYIMGTQVLLLLSKEKILVIISIVLGLINIVIKLYFSLLTPVITISITVFLQFFILIMLYLYIKFKTDLEINFFSINFLKYLLASFIFLILIKIVEYKLNLDFKHIKFILIFSLICWLIYFKILVILREKRIRGLIKLLVQKK